MTTPLGPQAFAAPPTDKDDTGTAAEEEFATLRGEVPPRDPDFERPPDMPAAKPEAGVPPGTTFEETREQGAAEPIDGLIAASAPHLDLNDYDEGEAEEYLAEWSIADYDDATHAARRWNRLRERKETFRAVRDEQIARAREWYDREAGRIEADQRFYAGRLEAFHRHMLELDPRNAKTIRLPDGTELRSQSGKLAVEVVSVPQFIAWAEENECAEEFLNYPEPEPKKVVIAKRMGEKAKAETDPGTYSAFSPTTGEAVPGISIVRRERTFTIAAPIEVDAPAPAVEEAEEA